MRLKGESSDRLLRLQSKIIRTVTFLWSIKSVRRKVVAVPLCVLGLITLTSWTFQSHSCALGVFLGLIAFDVLSLLGDIFSQFYIHGGKQTTAFSFGYVRVEVLTHFSILCLGLLLNAWAVKNSLELVLGSVSQEIHTGRFVPTVVIGGIIHFFLSFSNSPFLKVYKVSASTTTLQKYFQGICASFGISLSSSNAFSLSPFAILGLFCCNSVILLALALQSGPRWFDFVGGLLMVLAVFDALWPLCLYTGQVLLQTVPAHTASQLEQSVREALTIDGVLEFRNELFWTLSYGQIAGTVHVRVRRDANEQLVLSKVHEKLQPLAPHLTVQVIKDDFGRPFHTIQIGRDVSPLTKLGTGEMMTPIPRVPPPVNNIIYTSSSVTSSHVPYNSAIKTPGGVNDSITSPSSSMLQVHVDPKQYVGSSSSNNVNPQYSLQLPHQQIHSPIYSQVNNNGGHQPNNQGNNLLFPTSTNPFFHS